MDNSGHIQSNPEKIGFSGCKAQTGNIPGNRQ